MSPKPASVSVTSPSTSRSVAAPMSPSLSRARAASGEFGTMRRESMQRSDSRSSLESEIKEKKRADAIKERRAKEQAEFQAQEKARKERIRAKEAAARAEKEAQEKELAAAREAPLL